MKVLSLAKNKQLQDSDFENAFKTGLHKLTSLDCSYSNLTGQSLKYLNCDVLKRLNINCCSKLKNKGLLVLLKNCNTSLQYLDISVTKVNDELFYSIPKQHLSGLKSLFIDFCSAINLSCLKDTLFESFHGLKNLSMYGTSSENFGEFHVYYIEYQKYAKSKPLKLISNLMYK